MALLVGVILALAVCAFGTLVRFDRSRAFYPTMLIVVASYYGLFAVMGGSTPALLIETAVIATFVLTSVLGFKFNLWLVAGGLFAHGVLDSIHGHVITNPGVPTWWPMFCGTFDVIAAAYLAYLLSHRRDASATRPLTDSARTP